VCVCRQGYAGTGTDTCDIEAPIGTVLRERRFRFTSILSVASDNFQTNTTLLDKYMLAVARAANVAFTKVTIWRMVTTVLSGGSRRLLAHLTLVVCLEAPDAASSIFCLCCRFSVWELIPCSDN